MLDFSKISAQVAQPTSLVSVSPSLPIVSVLEGYPSLATAAQSDPLCLSPPSLRGAPRGSPSARPSESRESPEKPHEVPGSDLRLFAVGLFLRCSGGEQKVIATHAERAEGLAPALAAQQRSLASAGPLRRAILRNGRTKKRKTNRATRLTRKARFGPTKSYWTHKKITTEPRATSGNRSPTKKATKRRAPTRSWAHTMTGPDPRGYPSHGDPAASKMRRCGGKRGPRVEDSFR